MCCQYAGGRAEGAPQLRRELDTRNQGILACEAVYTVEQPVGHEGRVYPGVWHEGRYVAEAYLHPDGTLPHFLKGDLDVLFPKAVAGKELDETQEKEDPLEERGKELGKQKKSKATVEREKKEVTKQ